MTQIIWYVFAVGALILFYAAVLGGRILQTEKPPAGSGLTIVGLGFMGLVLWALCGVYVLLWWHWRWTALLVLCACGLVFAVGAISLVVGLVRSGGFARMGSGIGCPAKRTDARLARLYLYCVIGIVLGCVPYVLRLRGRPDAQYLIGSEYGWATLLAPVLYVSVAIVTRWLAGKRLRVEPYHNRLAAALGLPIALVAVGVLYAPAWRYADRMFDAAMATRFSLVLAHELVVLIWLAQSCAAAALWHFARSLPSPNETSDRSR